MLIFPFQSNSEGSLLCVKSELYIPRILKKTKNKILLHLGTNDPTSFFSFNTYRFKIKAIYLDLSIDLYYIDTDEIPGFFLLLQNHIFIVRSEDTIFIFHV